MDKFRLPFNRREPERRVRGKADGEITGEAATAFEARQSTPLLKQIICVDRWNNQIATSICFNGKYVEIGSKE